MTSDNYFFHKNILGKSSGVFFLRVINSLITLVLSIIIARCLGVHEYGVYAYVITCINLLVIPACAGLPELITKNIASYLTGSKWDLFKGILIKSTKITIIFSTLIIVISLLIIFLLKNKFPDNITVFLLALILIPISALNQLRAAALRGLHKVIISQIPDILIQPLILIIILLCFVYLFKDTHLSSSDIIMARAVSIAVAFILGSFLLNKYIPLEAKISSPQYDTVIWRQSAITFMIIQGINQMFNQTDILMLGLLGNVESVGLYKVASNGALLIGFGLLSVNTVLGPIISKLAAEKKWDKLQSIITYSSRLIFIATFPFAIGLIFYGKEFINIIYGPQFTSGSKTLAILSFGQLINAALGSVGLILNMTGNEKSSLIGQVIALSINFILNLTSNP